MKNIVGILHNILTVATFVCEYFFVDKTVVKVNNYAIYVDVPSAKIAVILLHEAEVRYNYQHAKVLQTDEHKRKPKVRATQIHLWKIIYLFCGICHVYRRVLICRSNLVEMHTS